jgi:hypothetical protein
MISRQHFQLILKFSYLLDNRKLANPEEQRYDHCAKIMPTGLFKTITVQTSSSVLMKVWTKQIIICNGCSVYATNTIFTEN